MIIFWKQVGHLREYVKLIFISVNKFYFVNQAVIAYLLLRICSVEITISPFFFCLFQIFIFHVYYSCILPISSNFNILCIILCFTISFIYLQHFIFVCQILYDHMPICSLYYMLYWYYVFSTLTEPS